MFENAFKVLTSVIAAGRLLAQGQITEFAKRSLDPVCLQIANTVSSATDVWYPGAYFLTNALPQEPIF